MTGHIPPTEQQLNEYEALIQRATPLGAATASPGMAAVLLAEVRRLRTQRRVLIAAMARKDARTGEGDRALREFLAAPEAADAPVTPEQPAEGAGTRDDTTQRLLRTTEHYLGALHGSVARHDNLAANYGCAGCELLATVREALAVPAVETGR